MAAMASSAVCVRKVTSRTGRPPATRAFAKGTASSTLSMVRTGITGALRIKASAVRVG